MPPGPSDQEHTSRSLLERARGRDAAARRRLVELYSSLVYFWARRAQLTDADAADLVQEVWQSVATALSRFEHGERRGSFRAWLWTITLNHLTAHSRKREGEPAAAGGTDARQLSETVPDQEPVDETGVQEN